jgi:hypothetical protein
MFLLQRSTEGRERRCGPPNGSEDDAVGGVEEHLLELPRQVAVPYQASSGAVRGDPSIRARTMPTDSIARLGSGGPSQSPVRWLGPVRTAVGQQAVAANASVMGSDRRNGESVKPKPGWLARMTASHGS